MKKTEMKKTKKTNEYTCFLCKERTSEYVEYKGKRYHKECVEQKKKNEQEQEEWVDLYEYVFKKVLGYKDGMKMPQYMILRLKGLRDGQFMSNKTVAMQADYSFKVILYTFKAKAIDLRRLESKMDFKDENHRFNTIMKIIENNINDIVIRLEKNKKANQKLDKVDGNELQLDCGKEFKSTKEGEDKIAEKFKNLW